MNGDNMDLVEVSDRAKEQTAAAERIEKFHVFAGILTAMGESSAGEPYNGDEAKIEARIRELGVNYEHAAAQHLDTRESWDGEPRCAFCATPKLVGFVSVDGKRRVSLGRDPVACIACAQTRRLPPFDNVKAKK